MKVLLVDDHQILRDGIRRGLESAGKDVVGEAGNGEEAIGLVGETDPDIVVMDLSMPVLDGVGATRQISELYPDVKVVVLTMHDDPAKTRAALEAGAVAYLTKGTSLDEVIDTLDRVMDGEEVLSPHLAASMLQVVGGLKPTEESLLSDRQVEILQMIANGLSPSRWPASWGSPRRRCTTTSTPSTAASTPRASRTPCCRPCGSGSSTSTPRAGTTTSDLSRSGGTGS